MIWGYPYFWKHPDFQKILNLQGAIFFQGWALESGRQFWWVRGGSVHIYLKFQDLCCSQEPEKFQWLVFFVDVLGSFCIMLGHQHATSNFAFQMMFFHLPFFVSMEQARDEKCK